MYLRKWMTVAAMAAMLVGATPAKAVNCKDLPGPIYVAGSTAVQNLVYGMAKSLAASQSPANTIVYQGLGSCVGVNAIVMDDATKACVMGGACLTGNAVYFDNTGATLMCALEANGTHADVGVSDVFANTCPSGLPAGFTDANGPVQPMTYAVPVANTQTYLTAEMGYFIFGFGAMAGMAAPFTNDAESYVRSASSGTQIILARSIGVPEGKIKGVSESSGTNVFNALTMMSPMPANAIGFLGASTVDAHRDTVKALAFRAYNQTSAFYPDSTPSAFDKQNVRDGHYVPWGYEHFITSANASAGAKNFVSWVTGATQPAWANTNTLAATNGLIPICAMHVKRSGEGNGNPELSFFDNTAPCDCSFEFAATKATSCTACPKGTECAAGQMCRAGYCEAK